MQKNKTGEHFDYIQEILFMTIHTPSISEFFIDSDRDGFK